MQLALRTGQLEIVKLLICMGARVQFNDVLLSYSGTGRTEVVELLLNHGADVNTARPGVSPLGLALLRDDREECELIIRQIALSELMGQRVSRFTRKVLAQCDSTQVYKDRCCVELDSLSDNRPPGSPLSYREILEAVETRK